MVEDGLFAGRTQAAVAFCDEDRRIVQSQAEAERDEPDKQGQNLAGSRRAIERRLGHVACRGACSSFVQRCTIRWLLLLRRCPILPVLHHRPIFRLVFSGRVPLFPSNRLHALQSQVAPA